MNADSEPQRTAEHAEWRVEAHRLAPLVDGVEYYRCLRRSLMNAEEQVLIVGWDLHSEIDLLRGEEAERAEEQDGWPVRLADILLRLVKERDSVIVKLLIWEGASVFAFERQHLPRMKMPWGSHPRIELVWDRDTPRLASHHQKLVVIDDALAFAGGMDLTKSRWDDHPHEPEDPRRRDPGLIPNYGQPYHDIMLALDADAAQAIGDWIRERWKRATGKEIEPPKRSSDPWPEALKPVFENQHVSIALTQPEFAGRPELRQIETSYRAQIASARKLIFIESQYLTAESIVDALCARLRESDGPEVVLILPYGCPAGLQSIVMDPWRDDLLDRMRDADTGGRLGVYWPTLRGGAKENVFENSVYVHAKTMVVDDRLLRIGSANLNNRSMGLDTELDVFFEVDEEESEQVAAYRRRLLAYLLDTRAEALASAEDESGSVIAAIESLRGGERTLHPFDHRAGVIENNIALPANLADPDRPLADLDADRVAAAIEDYKSLADRAGKAVSTTVGKLREWLPVLVLIAAA